MGKTDTVQYSGVPVTDTGVRDKCCIVEKLVQVQMVKTNTVEWSTCYRYRWERQILYSTVE